MKLFEGMLTKRFLRAEEVVFKPSSPRELLEIVSYLREKMGLSLDSGFSFSRSLRDGFIVRNGGVIDNGPGTDGLAFKSGRYFAEAKNLIPGYVDPVSAQFNALSQKVDVLQKKIDDLEERSRPKTGVVKTVIIQ
ncbi:MAG: hypothetical protein AB7H77_12430 [Bdellovibrionales bacterium]